MKKVKAIVKLQIPAGEATPAPPVGPALAQQGLNIPEFCQKFNEATKNNQGFKIPVEITVYEDSPALSQLDLTQFHFEVSGGSPGRKGWVKLKQPPAAELLKKAAGIEKGSGEPNRTKVAKISKEQLRKIAEQKMPDLNTPDLEAAMKIIEGTAKSMGIEIER